MNSIKVAELFAGVGGFRIGLESVSVENGRQFKVVWSNQWEPSTKKQHASDVYAMRFGEEGHSNVNIAEVPTSEIPQHDLLVGGFPCQDYSVARTLSSADGIVGKKGVLWWEIFRILKEKQQHDKKGFPKYVFLENVDRLLKSPSKRRGRDFAIMLSSLNSLGYAVEWRVINAADHGFPQRRRRVFILAYHKSTAIYKQIKDAEDWLLNSGVIAQAFKVTADPDATMNEGKIEDDLVLLTEEFNRSGSLSPFENTGLMIHGQFFSIKTKASFDGKRTLLGDILIDDKDVPKEYFIDDADIDKWLYLKGPKKEVRTHRSSGAKYNYNEGGMIFPDPLSSPSRTIITGEGGKAPSRFKHVVKTKSGKLRRLTPVELERLNMFPDGHTKGASDTKRAFFMGNALVIGVIEGIGKQLAQRIGE